LHFGIHKAGETTRGKKDFPKNADSPPNLSLTTERWGGHKQTGTAKKKKKIFEEAEDSCNKKLGPRPKIKVTAGFIGPNKTLDETSLGSDAIKLSTRIEPKPPNRKNKNTSIPQKSRGTHRVG